MTMTDEPTVFGTTKPSGLTMLDGLLTDIDDHPHVQDRVEIALEKRPGWSLQCSTDIPYENLAAWRKGAQDSTLGGGSNELKLGCSILVHACNAILVDGEPLTIDGELITFTSQPLMAKLDVSRPADAVRKMFVRDGFVTSAAQALLREAGYGSEATPTRR